MKKWKLWRRRRRFIKAYTILRKEADRHKAAGHQTEFKAVNESMISLQCPWCPDLQP